MKYDLNRLKEAVDEQIPAISPDEGLLDRAMKQAKRPNGRRVSASLTAAAACVLLLAMLASLLAPGLHTRPDDVGDGRYALSQGNMPGAEQVRPTAQPDAPQYLLAQEDLSAYSPYSPMYAHTAFPEEATFGDVVIRKETRSYEPVFIFYDRETDEVLFAANENYPWHGQGFAYFPATDTALVGNGEGMALVGRDGLITGYIYSHFEYVGGGTAIVGDLNEDETEPSPMYVADTATGEHLSRDYALIGTMRSGGVRLILGHDDYDAVGNYDLLAMDGRLIVRAGDTGGTYFDKWIAVRLPDEADYCLIDLDGNILMDGQRFLRVGFERDGYMIAVTKDGYGVIDSEGRWTFEPGKYLNIEITGGGLFRVTDRETGEKRQINAQGVEVDSLRFRMDMAVEKAAEAYGAWRETVGEFGYIVICLLAFWLLLRLGMTQRSGEIRHFLLTELGYAAYAAGLLYIGHRFSLDYALLWPTDTSTEGARAIAFWWHIASFGMLTSLVASFPKLRAPKKAFIAGYALLLLPWAWRAVCADVSVEGWQAFSMAVFGGGALLAVLLFWAKPVRRFMDWCARFDHLNEYAKGVRIVWWAIVLAALVNYGAGCFISGQEMVYVTSHADVQRGVLGRLGEAWVDDVNQRLADYPEDDFASEVRQANGMSERQYSAIAAARYLKANGVERLTEDMILRVKVTGTVKLRRPAIVQMMIKPETDAACQMGMEFGIALSDGTIEGASDFILLPGQPAPDIKVWLSIRQKADMDYRIAAQYWYRADLEDISVPDLAPADDFAPEDNPY